MKKFFYYIFVLSFCFLLFGCKNSPATPDKVVICPLLDGNASAKIYQTNINDTFEFEFFVYSNEELLGLFKEYPNAEWTIYGDCVTFWGVDDDIVNNIFVAKKSGVCEISLSLPNGVSDSWTVIVEDDSNNYNENLKNSFSSEITYNTLMRTPNAYLNKPIMINCYVEQVTENGTDVGLLVNSSFDDNFMSHDPMWIYYDSSIVPVRVLQNDSIIIYGISKGLYNYNNLYIPNIKAIKIEWFTNGGYADEIPNY